MDEFQNSTDTPAFICIEDKVAFIKDLKERCNNPISINQRKSSLCGPASFMYCIACEKPNEYAEYILDLAMTGKARLGNMEIAPSHTPSAKIKNHEIAPVDWVALGSLRDDSNSFFTLDPDSQIAGITISSTVAEWFQKTGWFKSVEDRAATRLQSMNNLLQINNLPTSYVCLLIRARIISAQQVSSDQGRIPDHWVVLGQCNGQGPIATNGMISGSQMCIAQQTPRPFQGGDIDPMPIRFGGEENAAYNNTYFYDKNSTYRKLEGQWLDFSVYTWGGVYSIKLTVEKFLENYFGFVSAQLK
jgi:hypothetical protein